MLDKKTRLNAGIRDAIVSNALTSSGYWAEQKQLVEDRAAFATKVHATVLAQTGVTEDSLDAQWQNTQDNDSMYIYSSDSKNSHFRLNLSGLDVILNFNGGFNCHDTTHIAPGWGEGSLQWWIPRERQTVADAALKDEFLALAARQDANTEKRTRIDTTVRAVLRSVNTVGKLLESWPEAYELLPDEMVRVSGTGLAIIPADLNALCGVPSEDKK